MKTLLLLLLLALPANAITLSTLRSDCRIMVLDTSANRPRFGDSQLNRFLNEGQTDFSIRSRMLRRNVTIELAVGTTYYTMPGDFLKFQRVTRDYLILPERSIQNLDKNQQWQNVSGLPINYFIHFSSRSSIGLYPFPDDSSSTGTLRIDYLALPDELSADGDEVFDGDQELQVYGYAVALYCAYRAAMIDNMPTMAQLYFQEYQHRLTYASEDATARPFYRPGAVSGRSRGSSPF